jgi:hypothetical protein
MVTVMSCEDGIYRELDSHWMKALP